MVHALDQILICAFHGTMRGEISEKVAGVYIQDARDTGKAQLDHAPVVARSTLAACFPSIHPFAAIRVLAGNEHRRPSLDQIFFRREKFVARGEHAAAHQL